MLNSESYSIHNTFCLKKMKKTKWMEGKGGKEISEGTHGKAAGPKEAKGGECLLVYVHHETSF